MCPRGTMTIVKTPDWLWDERADPAAGIAIDCCIADDIVKAWDRGVRTLGSCCGHDVEKPSIVIVSESAQINLARNVFPEWTIYQWQLVEV